MKSRGGAPAFGGDRTTVGPGPPLATSGEGRRRKTYAEAAEIVPTR